MLSDLVACSQHCPKGIAKPSHLQEATDEPQCMLGEATRDEEDPDELQQVKIYHAASERRHRWE